MLLQDCNTKPIHEMPAGQVTIDEPLASFPEFPSFLRPSVVKNFAKPILGE